MTFTAAFTSVASALGLLGLAVLLCAAVVTGLADLTGQDLAGPQHEEDRS